MCAAHWAALHAVAQGLGSLPLDGALHAVGDLIVLCRRCGALLTDASLTTLFSDLVTRLAATLFKVSLPCGQSIMLRSALGEWQPVRLHMLPHCLTTPSACEVPTHIFSPLVNAGP